MSDIKNGCITMSEEERDTLRSIGERSIARGMIKESLDFGGGGYVVWYSSEEEMKKDKVALANKLADSLIVGIKNGDINL